MLFIVILFFWAGIGFCLRNNAEQRRTAQSNLAQFLSFLSCCPRFLFIFTFVFISSWKSWWFRMTRIFTESSLCLYLSSSLPRPIEKWNRWNEATGITNGTIRATSNTQAQYHRATLARLISPTHHSSPALPSLKLNRAEIRWKNVEAKKTKYNKIIPKKNLHQDAPIKRFVA